MAVIIAFCGHREVEDAAAVRTWLQDIFAALLKEGATECWTGGKGAFSSCAADVARQFPQLRSTLVKAYLSQDCDPKLYTDSLFPPLEDVPRRFAMHHRDRYMAQHADVLVMYVRHSFGNSMNLRDYALRQGKRVICYPDLP